MSSVRQPPHQMRIRKKRAGDDPVLGEISREAFGEYSPKAGLATVGMTKERGALTWVVVVDGEVRGFAVLKLTGGSEGYVNAIAVDASFRGRGIGRKLLRGLIAEAAERGVRVLRLVTAEANLGAMDLFIDVGFRIEHREPGYYPRGQDAVSMQLPIG